MPEVNVYELYEKAREAYGAIPRAGFKVTIDGELITLSCPTCGTIFARYHINMYQTFGEPIFCCGKLLNGGVRIW